MSSASTSNELVAPPLTRRVVTGTDAHAKSKVLYDDTKAGILTLPGGSGRLQDLWITDSVPTDCSSATEVDPTQKTLEISNEGSICRVVSMSPGSSAPMHRTQTIDYGVILEGEIELELETGEGKVLKAGDVVVQRGTIHAWHNRNPTQWAKAFFVLVRAKEE